MRFNGREVNCHELGRSHGFDAAYLWRLLTGRKDPGGLPIKRAKTLSVALHMGLEEFIYELYHQHHRYTHDQAAPAA